VALVVVALVVVAVVVAVLLDPLAAKVGVAA